MSSIKWLDRFSIAFLATCIALGLAGCTPAEPEVSLTPAESWVAPDWMQAAAREVAEYQAGMRDCLAGFGLRGVAGVGGTVGVGAPTDASGGIPSGWSDHAATAQQDCLDQVSRPSHWGLPLDEDAYERMLEVRECLLSHTDIQIPDPPPFEIWVQSQLPWNPWSQVSFRTFSTDAEFRALADACPQSGVGIFNLILDSEWD